MEKVTIKWIIAGAFITFLVLGFAAVMSGALSSESADNEGSEGSATRAVLFENLGMH